MLCIVDVVWVFLIGLFICLDVLNLFNLVLFNNLGIFVFG